MSVKLSVCGAVLATMIPAMALADDPRDPTMRSAAARARDSDTTRQLNLAAGALVRERDARQMRRMQDERASGDGDGYEAAARDDADRAQGYVARSQDYTARSRDHERDMADYARNRARYEQDMAAWHQAVDACRDGDYRACGY